MKLLICLLLLSLSAFAKDLAKRPPAFAYANSRAVFVDFHQAHYEITYDVNQKKAFAVAHMKFETAEAGHPIFDSHVDPTQILLDGRAAQAPLVASPDNKTKFRILSIPVAAGLHQMTVSLPITQLVEFTSTGVKSAFWMSDLNDRGYLERYLPTNLLYDRIPMSFQVRFLGAKEKQAIYTNGQIQNKANRDLVIKFSPVYNANCPYFHTVPASTVSELRFSYRSLDGRDLPAVVYLAKSWSDQSARLQDIKKRIVNIMDELEGDYGPFPHSSLTVYVAGSGGMEYSGATMTSLSALGHELFHSYFARGVLHADGNSGWIDEALASWRDDGYPSRTSLSGTSRMANLGTYNRTTDRGAYTFGANFMAYLDGKLKAKGGLKPYLRKVVEHKIFDPINVPEFVLMMNQFYGLTMDADFRRYVYGQSFQKLFVPQKHDHPIHKQLSLSELKELL